MGIKLRMISSDVNAAITPKVGVGYTLLPGLGRFKVNEGQKRSNMGHNLDKHLVTYFSAYYICGFTNTGRTPTHPAAPAEG